MVLPRGLAILGDAILWQLDRLSEGITFFIVMSAVLFGVLYFHVTIK